MPSDHPVAGDFITVDDLPFTNNFAHVLYVQFTSGEHATAGAIQKTYVHIWAPAISPQHADN